MSDAALSTDDPLIGSTLAGRYQIQARVGSGAMGAVYRAVQSGLGRSVALKVLKRDMAWGGDTVQRFRREAQAMSALHHPHTVRVFDFGATHDGVLYLAMELLEGEPVTQKLLAVGALSVREAVQYTQAVLRSIGEAHAKGIVHRDLKPDNIFLAYVEGESTPMVKVLDFGIAKAIEGDRKIDQFETLDGTVFGTPRYMAPEQAAGKALDPRTDLYAVGIMLYEFLSGQPPFVDADAVVVMAKHIRETPVPVGKLMPNQLLPKSLEAAVSKALEKNPADRFQTADEFDRALTAALPEIERFDRLTSSGLHKTLLGRTLLSTTRQRVMIAGSLLLSLLIGAWIVLHDSAEVSVADDAAAAAASSAANTPPSAASTAPQVVSVRSEPSGAQVWRGTTQLGITPLDVVVGPHDVPTISLRKPGFIEHTVELSPREATRTVTLNALPAQPTRVVTVVKTVPQEVAASATDRKHPKRGGKHGAGSNDTTNNDKPKPAEPSSPYEKF